MEKSKDWGLWPFQEPHESQHRQRQHQLEAPEAAHGQAIVYWLVCAIGNHFVALQFSVGTRLCCYIGRKQAQRQPGGQGAAINARIECRGMGGHEVWNNSWKLNMMQGKLRRVRA
jgi:hypothetical protein